MMCETELSCVRSCAPAPAIALAPPRAEGDAACLWGIEPKTGTTLSLHSAGEPAPKALHFHRALLYNGGTGCYARQPQAMTCMRRTLKKMGVLPTWRAREVGHGTGRLSAAAVSRHHRPRARAPWHTWSHVDLKDRASL